MVEILVLALIGLVGLEIRSSAKKFERIEKLLTDVAMNGPLIKIDKTDEFKITKPMTKRGKRAMIERILASKES